MTGVTDNITSQCQNSEPVDVKVSSLFNAFAAYAFHRIVFVQRKTTWWT